MKDVTVGAVIKHIYTILLLTNIIKINKAKKHKLCAI